MLIGVLPAVFAACARWLIAILETFIAKTTVPWTAEWLAYCEIWSTTRTWFEWRRSIMKTPVEMSARRRDMRGGQASAAEPRRLRPLHLTNGEPLGSAARS